MLWLTSNLLAAPLVVATETIAIDAPADAVWEVLVDLESYADWNAWLVRAEGSATLSEDVRVWVLLGDEEPLRARHRIIEVDAPNTLCWKDLGWFTPLARGQRCRNLESADGVTELHVQLIVTGPFKGRVERFYGDALRDGLHAELESLKARVEDG